MHETEKPHLYTCNDSPEDGQSIKKRKTFGDRHTLCKRAAIAANHLYTSTEKKYVGINLLIAGVMMLDFRFECKLEEFMLDFRFE